MMEPGYKIDADIPRRFVRLTLHGFWDEATLERYKADIGALIAAGAKLPTKGAGFRVLLDMRAHVLLAKDHADSLKGAVSAPLPGQRTAILADAQLLKLQAGRVASALEPRFFGDEAEAIAWLFDSSAA